MPDFPKAGGATAAEVAAAVLVDTGVKIDAVKLDATVASRAVESTVAKSATALSNAVWIDAKAGYLTGNVALDSTVAKESGNVATVMGKTNNLPADPASNTQVNTRAAPGAQMALTGAEETAIQGKIIDDTTPIHRVAITKIQDFLEEGTGTLTADGTEQILRAYVGLGKLHAYIDLTNMVAGNSVTVRQYMTIKTAGAYAKYAEETYAGVQTLPLLHLIMKPGKFGVKVTLQQAAVVYKTYDWETLVEQAAA